jgi:hypothetical protein
MKEPLLLQLSSNIIAKCIISNERAVEARDFLASSSQYVRTQADLSNIMIPR